MDDENRVALFRNVNLAWYANNPENATQITYDKLNGIAPEELLAEINRGFQVEQITRVTGYFSKVGSWNKGKKAELKDRYRSFDERGF